MKVSDLVPTSWKLAGAALLAVALLASAAWYRQHLVGEGRAQERQQHELADAKRARIATAALATANNQVAAKQAALDVAVAALAEREKDLHGQQKHTAALQSALAAGRVRLPVAATCAGSHPARPGEAGPAAGLDTQPATGAELDPAAAVRVVELTGTGDGAIVRLNACIAAYDAAVQAVE